MRNIIILILFFISNIAFGQFVNITNIFAEIEVDGSTIYGEADGSFGGYYTDQIVLKAANIDIGKVLNADGGVGQTIQRPFVIKKGIDRASVLLIDAMTNNKILNKIIIRMLGFDNAGQSIVRFVYTFDYARILSIKHTELLNPNSGNTDFVETLRLTFNHLSIDDYQFNTTTVIDNTPAP